jgi:hypothetical protein
MRSAANKPTHVSYGSVLDELGFSPEQATALKFKAESFLDGSFQARPNGFAHARHRQEVKGLLNGIPIFLGHQHGIGARTGN